MRIFVMFATFLGLATFVTSAGAQAPIRRVAVLVQDQNFQTQSASVGRRIGDGLISALAGSGRFQVIDRANLDKVLSEQTQDTETGSPLREQPNLASWPTLTCSSLVKSIPFHRVRSVRIQGRRSSRPKS